MVLMQDAMRWVLCGTYSQPHDIILVTSNETGPGTDLMECWLLRAEVGEAHNLAERGAAFNTEGNSAEASPGHCELRFGTVMYGDALG